jgi:hypothetical protein
MNTYNWQGASGRWYEFEIVRATRTWEPVGGVYMFVKPHDQPTHDWGGPITLFAAKTDDFARTLARHDMWAAAENLGAKEIHILVVRDPAARERVEADVLEAQRPILNRRQTMKRVA